MDREDYLEEMNEEINDQEEEELEESPKSVSSPKSVEKSLEEEKKEEEEYPPFEEEQEETQTVANREEEKFEIEEIFPENKYTQLIKDSVKNFLKLAYGNSEDGWQLVETKRGVEIMKMNIPNTSYTTVKGKGVINAPPSAVVEFIGLLERKGEYDDMFERGEVVEQVDPFLYIWYQKFYGQWPTSARDIVHFSALRPLNAYSEKEGWISVAKSIEHDKCPPVKGNVRANLNLAGFVLERSKESPLSTVVTYVAQIDVMGNIPGFVLNMIATSQPLVVAGIREIMEAERTDYSEYEDSVANLLQEQINKYKSNKKGRKKKVEKKVSFREEKKTLLTDSAPLLSPDPLSSSFVPIDKLENSKHSPPSFSRLEEISPISKNHSIPNVSDTSFSSNSPVDLQMHFNEGESNTADSANSSFSSYDLEKREGKMGRNSDSPNNNNSKPIASHSLTNPPNEKLVEISPKIRQMIVQSVEELSVLAGNSGNKNWSTPVYEKGVCIMVGKKEGSEINLVKGYGKINASPEKIRDALVDLAIYPKVDKLFQTGRILEQINERTDVRHCVFEGTKCLIKQKRDFVYLTHWKKRKDGSIIIIGKSVPRDDVPSPEKSVRGEILTSGWIIKPDTKHSSSFCAYITQTDLKGLPSIVINQVNKEQPLIIRNLEKYFENETKN